MVGLLKQRMNVCSIALVIYIDVNMHNGTRLREPSVVCCDVTVKYVNVTRNG